MREVPDPLGWRFRPARLMEAAAPIVHRLGWSSSSREMLAPSACRLRERRIVSRKEIKRWVLLTAIAGPACVFASILFPPFLLLGVAISTVGGLGLAIGYSRSTGRWSWVVSISATVVVFIAAAAVCFAFWGQAFNLAEQNAPVPAALEVAIAVFGVLIVLAFIAFVVIVALVASRASRRLSHDASAARA
jgi:hypothetical protein